MSLKHALKSAVSKPPVLISLILATLLLILFFPGALRTWSPMGASFAFDQFTLPRCGLAIRFGTDPFTSSADYPMYGYFATNWASHPLLCVLAGAPLSYLAPKVELLLTTLLYWLLHLWILIAFGSKLVPNKTIEGRSPFFQWSIKDYLAFSALGFFFPWYVIYVLGQYHALAVFALALILVSESNLVTGFILSAIGKPVLAPAAFALLVAKKWRAVFKISLFCALCYIPWFVFRYSVPEGIHLGWNQSFIEFFNVSAKYTRYSVPGWNQEMGWAKIFDEFVSVDQHLYIRYAMAFFPVALSIVLAKQKKLQLAIGVAALWFFLLYGRGHEYHYTLYLPLLAFLYCQPDGRYRTWFTVAITLLCALPTVFPLFMSFYDFPNHAAASNEAMRNANPYLYWLFLIQRPMVAPLLLGQIWWTELIKSPAPKSV